MKDLRVKIKEIKKIKPDVFLLSFDADYFAKKMQPGQFLEILIDSPELNLRRPFCIHHTKGKTVYVLFRLRGRGTELLSKMKKGDELNVLGPLGNGFQISNLRSQIVFVAGGMGVAPLLSLAAKLPTTNYQLQTIIIGAATKDALLCKKDFKAYGFKVIECTDDGSAGFKGNTVECLESYLSNFKFQISDFGRVSVFACGPEVMFKGLAKLLEKYPDIQAQASFEQFMGCGIGTCRGCIIETRQGKKRVCKDGPVFDLREIIF